MAGDSPQTSEKRRINYQTADKSDPTQMNKQSSVVFPRVEPIQQIRGSQFSRCKHHAASSLTSPRKSYCRLTISSRSPAVLLLCLALLMQSVFPQSNHWSNNGTCTLQSPVTLMNTLGSFRQGNTVTTPVILDLKATDYPTSTCLVGTYSPTFSGGAIIPLTFNVSCPQTQISSLESSYSSAVNIFTINHKTGNIAYITAINSTAFRLAVPQYSGNTLTTNLLLSDVIVPPSGTAIECVADMDGTNNVLAIIRGTTANPHRAYIIDVSGNTLTAGNPILFPSITSFGAITVSVTIQSKSLIVLGGLTFALSFPPTKNFYLYLYDIYSSTSTFTFKAFWQNSILMPSITVADNLNGQDYIYTMLIDTSNINSIVFYLGVIRLSGFMASQSGTTPQTGDIFAIGVNAKKVYLGTDPAFIMNAGTLNYVMTFLQTSTFMTAITLYPKTFSSFGASPIQLPLPSFGSQTKAGYTYGFFAYGPSEPFSLYYQTTGYSAPLIKATLFQCQPGNDYFHWATMQCYPDTAVPPSGYRQNSNTFEYEACSVANCATCPDSAATCTNCKSSYSLSNNLCITCNVALCNTCDTSNHCTQCLPGYLIDGSNNCPITACDTTNGYSFNSTTHVCSLPCTATNCAVCKRTNGALCDQCATGWLLSSGTCSTCDSVNGYAMIGGTCVLQCPSVGHCLVCSTMSACQTCETGYLGSTCSDCDTTNGYAKVGGLCVLQCPTVSHCNLCATTTTCQTCAPGYLGTLCSTCDTANGYLQVGTSCVLQCPSVSRCTLCATTTTCATCNDGYTGPLCLSCASGYFPDPANASNCLKCSIPSCTQCSADNVCSKCSGTLQLSADGSQCMIPIADSCKSQISTCSVCKNSTACQTCTTGFTPSSDLSSCLLSQCAVEHCSQCQSNSSCTKCASGFQLSDDQTSCSLILVSSKELIFTQYSSETQTAFVQLTRPATDFDLKVFVYKLLDKISGKVHDCPYCSATIADGYSKALQFTITLDVELLSATLQASYPLSSVKSSRRLLQNTEEDGYLVVDNLIVHPNNTVDHQKMAYGAYTTINTFRFIATVTLGFMNTVNAFWSTTQFSWLQLWSLLPGKFLSYPDRLLNWHYKWYLLVINFGNAFKSYVDWNESGLKCVASYSYPTNQLGCSFFDNFGQNFLIILVIFLLCLLSTSILASLYLWKRKSSDTTRRNQYQEGTTSPAPQPTSVQTPLQSFTSWPWYRRLGIPYFIRFMDSIQPSLLYFSLMQFATYLNTPHIGGSTFIAVFFFFYFLASAVVSVLLARRMWITMKERNTTIADLALVASECGWMNLFSFHYLGFSRADYFWHLMHPVAEYTRILFDCIFLVGLRNSPKAGLGLILLVEILKAIVLGLMHRQRSSLIYSIQDYIVQTLYLLYIILKIAANNASSEDTAQMKIGLAMAVMWGFIWALILSNILIEVFIHVWPIIQKYRKGTAKQPVTIAPPLTTIREVLKSEPEVENNERAGINIPLAQPPTRPRQLDEKFEIKVDDEDILDDDSSNKNSPLPRGRDAPTQHARAHLIDVAKIDKAAKDTERDFKLESGSLAIRNDTQQRLTYTEEDQEQVNLRQRNDAERLKPESTVTPKAKLETLAPIITRQPPTNQYYETNPQVEEKQVDQKLNIKEQPRQESPKEKKSIMIGVVPKMKFPSPIPISQAKPQSEKDQPQNQPQKKINLNKLDEDSFNFSGEEGKK